MILFLSEALGECYELIYDGFLDLYFCGFTLIRVNFCTVSFGCTIHILHGSFSCENKEECFSEMAEYSCEEIEQSGKED